MLVVQRLLDLLLLLGSRHTELVTIDHQLLFSISFTNPLRLSRDDSRVNLAVAFTTHHLHDVWRVALFYYTIRQVLLLSTIMSVVDFSRALLGRAYTSTTCRDELLIDLALMTLRFQEHRRTSQV